MSGSDACDADNSESESVCSEEHEEHIFHSCGSSSCYGSEEDRYVGCESRGSSLQASDRGDDASEIDSVSDEVHANLSDSDGSGSHDDEASVLSESDLVCCPLCRMQLCKTVQQTHLSSEVDPDQLVCDGSTCGRVLARTEWRFTCPPPCDYDLCLPCAGVEVCCPHCCKKLVETVLAEESLDCDGMCGRELSTFEWRFACTCTATGFDICLQCAGVRTKVDLPTANELIALAPPNLQTSPVNVADTLRELLPQRQRIRVEPFLVVYSSICTVHVDTG